MARQLTDADRAVKKDLFYRLLDKGYTRGVAADRAGVVNNTARKWVEPWSESRGRKPPQSSGQGIDRQDRLEDYAWLRQCAVPLEEAARRIGVRLDTAREVYEPHWRGVEI